MSNLNAANRIKDIADFDISISNFQSKNISNNNNNNNKFAASNQTNNTFNLTTQSAYNRTNLNRLNSRIVHNNSESSNSFIRQVSFFFLSIDL